MKYLLLCIFFIVEITAYPSANINIEGKKSLTKRLTIHLPLEDTVYLLNPAEDVVNETISRALDRLPEVIRMRREHFIFPNQSCVSGDVFLNYLENYGFKETHVQKLKVDGSNLSFTAIVRHVDLNSYFKMNLIVAYLFPLYCSNCRTSAHADNLVIEGTAKLHFTAPLKISNAKIRIRLGDLSTNFHGLFNNEALSTIISSILNRNGVSFINENQEVLSTKFTLLLEPIINYLLETGYVPLTTTTQSTTSTESTTPITTTSTTESTTTTQTSTTTESTTPTTTTETTTPTTTTEKTTTTTDSTTSTSTTESTTPTTTRTTPKTTTQSTTTKTTTESTTPKTTTRTTPKTTTESTTPKTTTRTTPKTTTHSTTTKTTTESTTPKTTTRTTPKTTTHSTTTKTTTERTTPSTTTESTTTRTTTQSTLSTHTAQTTTSTEPIPSIETTSPNPEDTTHTAQTTSSTEPVTHTETTRVTRFTKPATSKAPTTKPGTTTTN